jgi:hypothetical protein
MLRLLVALVLLGGCDPTSSDLDAPEGVDAPALDTPVDAVDAPGFDAPSDVPPMDTPPAAGLVFANDWPVVGSTSDAVRGLTGATPWELRIGRDALSVVAAADEGIADGCPTPNALRTDLVYVGGDVQNMATDEVSMLPRSGAWPIPEVGSSLYYRIYARFSYPDGADPAPLGNNNHPLENQSGGITNWSWSFHTDAEGIRPMFQVWLGGAATRFAPAIHLARDAWYRIEMRLHRTGVDERAHELRIYDATGALVADDGDFIDTGSTTALTDFVQAFSDLSGLDGWQVGTNGPHVIGATRGAAPAWYWAAAAVSASDWCGPYVAGESP